MNKFIKKILFVLLSSIMVVSLLGSVVAFANTTTETPTVINPIAKYEFKDANDLGKDSMGNYHMEYRSSDSTEYNTVTAVDTVNGGVTFNGGLCLSQDAESNMFKDVAAFTLCFEIITDDCPGSWNHYIGVGATQSEGGAGFAVVNATDTSTNMYNARLWAADLTENGSLSPYSAETFIPGGTEITEYQKVVMSVQPGGVLAVYLNGTLCSLSNLVNVPEDFSLANAGYYFSVGGRCTTGLVPSSFSAGSIRNVQFYDFAMDDTCATAYYNNNQITTADTVNLPIINGLKEIVFEGEVSSVELTTAMTTDKMLKALNSAKAKLNLSNGSFVNAPITWVGIEVDNGEYFAKGSINADKLGYKNEYGNEVSYKLEVSTTTETGTVVKPIAKYEFKDADNLGKDSMGNFDMEYRNLWVAGGTGALLNTYTAVDEENGGVTFNGEFCLAQDNESNMFKNVSAFTLCFEIKTGEYLSSWQHYLGVGGENGISVIGVDNRTSNLYNARLQAPRINGTYWSSEPLIGNGSLMTEYQSVVLVVAPGGELGIYVNGSAIEPTKDVLIPEDYLVATKDSYKFSIGGIYNGAVTKTSSGSIRNVQFYDFPMDATCVSAYNVYGQITTVDTVNLPTVSALGEVVFDGEPTSDVLRANMSESEMLSYVNPARGKVTLSNGLVTSSAITWERIEIKNGEYYVVGSITDNLGYENDCGTEFSYKLSVLDFKSISTPKFDNGIYKGELKNSMTETEMLALINNPTVTITYLDDTTKDVLTPLTKILLEWDKYVAYGDVIDNDTFYGTVSVDLEVDMHQEITATDHIMSFAFFSDTHFTSSWVNTNFLSALGDAKKVRPELSHAIVLGDLSDNGNSLTDSSVRDLYHYYDWLDGYDYKNSNGEQIPIYNVLGNHDVRGPSAEGYPQTSYQNAVETYLEREGVETLQWDTWINGYHFVFLNTDEYHKDYAIFNKETITWLDQTLSENEDGKPIFVMVHQPLGYITTAEDASMTFEEVIARHPTAIVSSGHTHAELGENSIVNEGNGVYINQPAMFSSTQYYIVDVYEGGVIFRAREASTDTWVIVSDVAIVDSSYDPSTPETPIVPDEPDEPDNPDEPEQPDNPDEPDEPDNPDEPEQPDNPDEPEQPDNPDEPEQPDPGKKKGCGSNILNETIIVSILTIVTATICLSRKKRS